METKSKRIKRVFTNSAQVLHLWANQSQSDARCANVFYEGDTCYSYGYHYTLGKITEYKGVKLAVINNSGYSVTTSKHIRQAQSAVNGLIPYVPTSHGFDEDAIFQGLLDMQGSLIDKFFKDFNRKTSRVYSYTFENNRWFADYNWLRDCINEFNTLVKDLKEDQLSIDINADMIELYDEKVLELEARYKHSQSPEELERKRLIEEAKEAKLEATRLEEIEKWKQGKPCMVSLYGLTRQLLRIKGDTLQTSSGAEVPLRVAQVAYKMFKEGKLKEGRHVGPFTYNGVLVFESGPVALIGCHRIEVKELDRVLGSES